MALEYFELVSIRSPSQAGFGLEGGRAVAKYITSEPLTIDGIQDAMRELVGDVDIDYTNPGKLKRTMPAAHPFFPNLYARDVQVCGLGVRDSDGNVMTVAPADPTLLVPPIADSAVVYARTELTVTFEPRVYDLIPDEMIEPEEIDYYRPQDGPSPEGAGRDSKEYLRFVDQEVIPAPQLAHFTTGGQLYFRTGNAPEPGELDPGDPRAMFAGTAFIVLPDGQFNLIWHAVPYSIFQNRAHAMYTFVGLVNQTEFFNWSPGQLQYLGANARRYTPTFPWMQTLDGLTAFSSEKLCDITFRFSYTTREATNPPDLAAVRGAWIANGWNAQPWAPTGKFYVATRGANDTEDDQRPIFISAPFQFLFSGPES